MLATEDVSLTTMAYSSCALLISTWKFSKVFTFYLHTSTRVIHLRSPDDTCGDQCFQPWVSEGGQEGLALTRF